MLYYLRIMLVLLFIASIFGYIFVILKEKIYLKNNIIIIDKKVVTQEHLNEADMKEFILDGLRVKAGDEIRVITKENKKYNGILLGAKKKDKSILMVTHRDEIKLFAIDNILKFKVVSKYGKFFN
ncbi:hypothetical protein KQI38_19220 [Tissierella carlieri]|uniref:Uncharacterized protein n=1 Tax=Tissierella carlieri TaxID=689904 RepID=A0ABT1S5Y4_9FIRM|nr:hypothetical protein [Tissierella carlieri]MBU5314154.1 hypothetical protein [Tissierella carlieri]MCQ4921866.1 hypothetical protein [Tissierella carlieri]